MSSLSQPLIPSDERTLTSRITQLARDYSELTKARVTTLILMTAWCGFFFGAAKEGVSSLSLTLLHALIGIGLVSAGTAAMNEVMERNLDAHMRRTSRRPLVTGSMSLTHGIIAASSMIVGGTTYLWVATNPLTALLTAATCTVYLLAYTPLKTVHPICTFIGAFPGAMPPVLGWTAIRGSLDVEAIVLFLILFHRVALSRRLRARQHPHVARGRKRWPLHSTCDHRILTRSHPRHTRADLPAHGRMDLLRRCGCTRHCVVVGRPAHVACETRSRGA
jgi:hypothetical protein